jgi:hypothetical protein
MKANTYYTLETLPIKPKSTDVKKYKYKGRVYTIFKTNVWAGSSCNPPEGYDCYTLCEQIPTCLHMVTTYRIADPRETYGWHCGWSFYSGLASCKACINTIRNKQLDKRQLRRRNRRRDKKNG